MSEASEASKTETSEKARIASGFTPKAVIVGLLIVVLVQIIMLGHRPNMLYNQGQYTNNYTFHLPILWLLPLVLINALAKSKAFTLEELGVIFSIYAPVMGILFGVSGGWLSEFQWTKPGFDSIKEFVPPIFYNMGAVTHIYWLIFYLSFAYQGLFFMLIFRRLFADVERLPFPLAQAISDIARGEISLSEEKTSLWKNKFLQIGLILGLIWSILKSRGYYTLTGINLAPYIDPAFANLTLYNIFPFLIDAPIYLQWSFDLLYFGVMLLAPMDWLLTGIVFYIIIYFIWAPIGIATGLIPPLREAGSPYVAMKYVILIYTHWRWHIASVTGGLLAYGLIPVILNWRYVKETFSAKESEYGVSYKLLWIGWLVSLIIWIAAMAAAGVPLYWAIPYALYIPLIDLARNRAFGEGLGHTLWTQTGCTNWAWYGNWTSGFAVTPFASSPSLYRSQAAAATAHVAGITYCFKGYDGVTASVYHNVWKVASNLKSSMKGVFKAQIITFAFSIILGYILVYVFTMTFGFADAFGGLVTAFYMKPVVESGKGIMAYVYNLEQFWTSVIGGFVLWAIITYLRCTIPAFWINPAAVIAWGVAVSHGAYQGGFTNLIFAYVAKRAVLSVGGTRLFNEKMRPFVYGLVIGAVLWAAVWYFGYPAVHMFDTYEKWW